VFVPPVLFRAGPSSQSNERCDPLAVLAAVCLTAISLAAAEAAAKSTSKPVAPTTTVVQTGPAASGKTMKTFRVVETEFALSPSTFTVTKPGKYTFAAVNHGKVVHSLEIEGRGA